MPMQQSIRKGVHYSYAFAHGRNLKRGCQGLLYFAQSLHLVAMGRHDEGIKVCQILHVSVRHTVSKNTLLLRCAVAVYAVYATNHSPFTASVVSLTASFASEKSMRESCGPAVSNRNKTNTKQEGGQQTSVRANCTADTAQIRSA